MRCGCKSKNCILKTKKIFEQYKLKRQIEYEQHIDNNFYKIIERSRRGIFTSTTYNTIKNTYNLDLCIVIKQYYNLMYEQYETLICNNNMYKNILEFSITQDKNIKLNLDLKAMATRVMYELKDCQAKNRNCLTQMCIIDLENIRLKVKLKRMTYIIKTDFNGSSDDENNSGNITDEGDITDNEEDITDNDDDYLFYKGQKYTNPNLTINKTNLEDLAILELYEKLKLYMVSNNISLSKIAKKNNVNVDVLFEKFGKIKQKRTQIAHPLPSAIKNDNEFMKLILDF